MSSPDDLLAAHVATIPAYRAWIRDMRTARQKLLAQGRSRDEPATPAPGAKPPTPSAAPLVDPALEAVIAAALGEETPVGEPAAAPLATPPVAETPVAPPEEEAELPDDPAARLKARFKGLEPPAAPTPAAPPPIPAPDKPLDAATIRGIYGDKEG